MEVHSPLIAMAEQVQDVADRVCSHLPLRALAALASTSRTLRALIQQLPEQAWLARAQHLPAWHPLLQAPSARTCLAQQARVHANLLAGHITEQQIDDGAAIVRPCLSAQA